MFWSLSFFLSLWIHLFYTTIFRILLFLWKSNFLSPFDALQKRSFSAYFHFYLSILSFFVVSSLRRFHWWYHTMSDYCTVDFGIFFYYFSPLIFSICFFSGRYLYDSSDYHSSYLLILITHLPFLWEMRCSHHDSTRSRNHENVRREINSGSNPHSFLHRHIIDISGCGPHTSFFNL